MRDQVRKADDWEKAIGDAFSRPLCRPQSYRSQSQQCICWAILIRPLTRTDRTAFCAKPIGPVNYSRTLQLVILFSCLQAKRLK